MDPLPLMEIDPDLAVPLSANRAIPTTGHSPTSTVTLILQAHNPYRAVMTTILSASDHEKAETDNTPGWMTAEPLTDIRPSAILTIMTSTAVRVAILPNDRSGLEVRATRIACLHSHMSTVVED
jgi:hypothetical protein